MAQKFNLSGQLAEAGALLTISPTPWWRVDNEPVPTVSTVTDKDGKWEVSLFPTPSKTDHKYVIDAQVKQPATTAK